MLARFLGSIGLVLQINHVDKTKNKYKYNVGVLIQKVIQNEAPVNELNKEPKIKAIGIQIIPTAMMVMGPLIYDGIINS
jgi:hypothetical protein